MASMPAGERLDDRDFLGELRAHQRALRSQLQELRAVPREGFAGDGGEPDLARVRLQESIVAQLANISARIIRVEREGTTVVICEDCGDEIPSERLAAVRAATRCARCQTLHERTPAGRRPSFPVQAPYGGGLNPKRDRSMTFDRVLQRLVPRL